MTTRGGPPPDGGLAYRMAALASLLEIHRTLPLPKAELARRYEAALDRSVAAFASSA